MGLKWAISYRFDDEADSYVLTNCDEETDQEQGELEGQIMLPLNGHDSDYDLDDLDDDLCE
jgi:hypothetical protein